MRMPGFAAEKSIHKTGEWQNSRADIFGRSHREMVIPQQLQSCYTIATCFPPVWVCQDTCFTFDGQPQTGSLYLCGFAGFGIPFTDLCVPGPSGAKYVTP